MEFDKLQPQFHIPSAEEVDFACEFVETFIYQELTLLNDKCSAISNDERLRSLTFILFISIGFLRMVPCIDSEEVLDRCVVLEKEADNQKKIFIFDSEPSVAPFKFKYKAQYSFYAKEPSE